MKRFILIYIVGLFISFTLFAQDGMLDKTFGDNGKVLSAISSEESYARCVEVQDDGKILVLGKTQERTVMVRYMSDGTIDESFGRKGFVAECFGNVFYEVREMKVTQNGKILLLGKSENNFAIIRYNANGEMDLSFGNGGMIKTDISTFNSKRFPLLILEDNKILLAGIGTNGAPVLARFSEEGELDESFGVKGYTVERKSLNGGKYFSVKRLKNGKIIAAGSKVDVYSSKDSIVLSRFQENGTCDLSFGDNGTIVMAENDIDEFFFDMTLDSDDNIFVLFERNLKSGILKYDINGNLVSEFNKEDISSFNSDYQEEFPRGILIQKNGNLLVAEYLTIEGKQHLVSVRYDKTGKILLVSEINDNNIIEHNAGFVELNSDVAELSDGKIVQVGSSYDQDLRKIMTVQRIDTNGLYDDSFGDKGIVKTPIMFGDDISIAFLGRKEGGFLQLVKSTDYYSNPRYTYYSIISYTSDGERDSKFGKNGAVVLSENGIRLIHITKSGKVLFVGNNDTTIYINSINNDGSYDDSFGENGKLSINFPKEDYHFAHFCPGSIVESPDGKLTILSVGRNLGYIYSCVMARITNDGEIDKTFGENGIVLKEMLGTKMYNSYHEKENYFFVGNKQSDKSNTIIAKFDIDGKLDSSFGENGLAKVGIGNSQESGVKSLALTEEGNILKVGFMDHDDNGSNVAVGKLLNNGVPDSSFGRNGIVSYPISERYDCLSFILLQNDGKIVAAGNADSLYVLIRFDKDGSIDKTFGNDGYSTGKFGADCSIVKSLIQQKDGKIVLVGDIFDNENFDVFIARFDNPSALEVENNSSGISKDYSLAQNYPNPFNPTTTISYSIPKEGMVKMSIYNVLGEEIKVIANGFKKAGNYSVKVNCSDLSSGIYLYKITSGSFTEVKKMMLIK